MAQIKDVKRLDDGAIQATIDGVVMCIPDDPTNRHRQMIAEWESVKGNKIK